MNKEQRRKRRQERRRLLEEYRGSGLAQKAFCESRGLPLSTLQYWLYTESKEQRQAPQNLVPVGMTTIQPSVGTIRIHTRNGLDIEVDLPIARDQLESILQAVAGL